MKDYTLKKKNTFAKGLLVALSVLCLAVGFGQLIRSTNTVGNSLYALDDRDLDTEPEVILL